MSEFELMEIYGGKISGVLINAAIKAVTTALELGRTIGSSIRRALAKKKCAV